MSTSGKSWSEAQRNERSALAPLCRSLCPFGVLVTYASQLTSAIRRTLIRSTPLTRAWPDPSLHAKVLSISQFTSDLWSPSNNLNSQQCLVHVHKGQQPTDLTLAVLGVAYPWKSLAIVLQYLPVLSSPVHRTCASWPKSDSQTLHSNNSVGVNDAAQDLWFAQGDPYDTRGHQGIDCHPSAHLLHFHLCPCPTAIALVRSRSCFSSLRTILLGG